MGSRVNRRVAELDSGAVKTIPGLKSVGGSLPLMPSFAVEVHPLAADEAECRREVVPRAQRNRGARFRRDSIGRRADR